MSKNNEYIIVHHSAVSYKKNSDQLKAIDTYHQKFQFKSKLGYWVGYHYLIRMDGFFTQTRGDLENGAHVKEQSMNYCSIGICLEGNFDEEAPTEKQLQTLKSLLEKLRNKYNISRDKVMFHRDFAGYKSCPGTWWIREKLNKIMALKELKRGSDGSFYFIKQGDSGKQKIDTSSPGVAALLTVISREFGVDQISSTELGKLKDKKYF